MNVIFLLLTSASTAGNPGVIMPVSHHAPVASASCGCATAAPVTTGCDCGAVSDCGCHTDVCAEPAKKCGGFFSRFRKSSKGHTSCCEAAPVAACGSCSSCSAPVVETCAPACEAPAKKCGGFFSRFSFRKHKSCGCETAVPTCDTGCDTGCNGCTSGHATYAPAVVGAPASTGCAGCAPATATPAPVYSGTVTPAPTYSGPVHSAPYAPGAVMPAPGAVMPAPGAVMPAPGAPLPGGAPIIPAPVDGGKEPIKKMPSPEIKGATPPAPPTAPASVTPAGGKVETEVKNPF